MAFREKTPPHLKVDEKNHVEEPFLSQLEGLGWKIIRLDNKQKPADSYRESFTEVVMLPVLRDSLLKINDWMTDAQVDEVVRRLNTFSSSDLIENNRQVLILLLEGTSVDENRRTGERNPNVFYVDFDKPENNSFIAISQYKLRIRGTEQHIYPDIILFLNGLPIAVIECKSPKAKEPIPEAIDQMMRYSEQRGGRGEGVPELFYYNQILVATSRQEAKFGTITTNIEKHFYRWSDPYPRTLEDLEHGASAPNEQQRLIAGMFDQKNLLSLIRTFTLFSTDDKGKTIKVVGRYQQFRAVKLAVERLLEGKNRRERSGIIWHTQGSGKSLTMVFLVREMYRHARLQSWKVIFITDRTQLEGQLGGTTKSIGLTVKVADRVSKMKELLPGTSSDLVMVMIHKFQEQELEETFPELNVRSDILIMTDEAHRSQYGKLGANLDRALPNATKIGFTGTPIDRTEEVFGDYIDKYTMRQSIEDGVTLEIVYEGRTHNAEVADQEAMDVAFQDVFSEYKITERLQILGYGSRDAYLESKDTISAKASDMMRHYIEQVFPNGFKAQVVATSREAAVRYKDALDQALRENLVDLERNNPNLIDLEKLKKLKTAVVISGSHNDKPHIKEHTDENKHKDAIARFKLPFDSEDENGIVGDVGIIIVNNMLLTGFDAPIEQVMYLDKVIRDHNLLQAIARVNRVAGPDKGEGFVVDYVGVGHHLKKALEHYFEKEQQEILDAIKSDEELINDLVATRRKVFDLIEKYGITDLTDMDAFYDLFYDEDIRFEYMLTFKEFARAMNALFPRKEALDYLRDYQLLTEINARASEHFRDERLSMKGIPEKLRGITDEYLQSKGISQKVAPISIFDAEFQAHVNHRKRSKTKAAEVEHAIRHHIDININDDPELYASFAEAIEAILRDFKNNWDEIFKRLEELRQRIHHAEQEPTYGLHRVKQMPFFRVFKKEFYGDDELTEDQIGVLVNLTQHIFILLEVELKLKGFWESIPARNRLKANLQELLLSSTFDNLPNVFQNRNRIISRIMELAETNNDKILYAA
jgi:type I restriction enzyme R subunit